MTSRQAALMEAMWAEGRTCKAISEATGVCIGSVASYICNHRELFPMRRSRQRRNEEMVARAAKMVERGLRACDIARELGVSHTTAARYVRAAKGGEAWEGTRCS